MEYDSFVRNWKSGKDRNSFMGPPKLVTHKIITKQTERAQAFLKNPL